MEIGKTDRTSDFSISLPPAAEKVTGVYDEAFAETGHPIGPDDPRPRRVRVQTTRGGSGKVGIAVHVEGADGEWHQLLNADPGVISTVDGEPL